MQTNILQKVIDELNREMPRLDYIKGMLETLVEMQSPAVLIPENNGQIQTPQQKVHDEGSRLDAEANARLAAIKAMGGSNTPE